MENSNRDIFTDEELDILSKTKKVRLNVIDDMTEDGMPRRSGDIRVLNETMDALDRQVMEGAKMRMKNDTDNDNSKIASMVVEILSRVTDGSNHTMRNTDIDLPDDFIPVDVVPGETDIESEQLALKDFIRSEGEDD